MDYDALMTMYVPRPQLLPWQQQQQHQQQQQQQRERVEGQGVERGSSSGWRDMKDRAGAAVAAPSLAAEVVAIVPSLVVVGGKLNCANMSDKGSGSGMQSNQERTGGRGKMTAGSQQEEGWGPLREQDLTSQLLQLSPAIFRSTR